MTSDPSAATPARPTVAPAPPLPPSTTRAAALQSRRSAVPPLASSARPTTGPHHGFRDLLRLYGRVAGRPYAHDATVYGAARTSPTSYYAHHLAAISASIVTADALVVLQAAAHLAEAGSTAHGRPFFSV